MKRLGVLLVLLLTSSALGNSYLDSRTDYYVAARLKLGLTTASSGSLTDTAASGFFSEAVTAILPLNRGVKRLTTFTTTYHEDTYELDSTLTGILAVRWTKNDSTKSLRYLPIELWGEQEHDKTTGKPKKLHRPSFYDFTDSLIILYPAPSKFGTADTIEIMGFHRVADIDTQSTPTVIPEHYRISILYHMVYNAALAGQDPRIQFFREQLVFQLQRIGLSLTPGGAVVSSNQ